MNTEESLNQEKKSSFISKLMLTIFTYLIILALIFAGLMYWLISAPTDVSLPITLQIEKGMSVRTIASKAKESGLVRSELLLYSILTVLNDPTKVHAGRYMFEEPQNVFTVASKFATADVDELLVTITIPEGTRAEKIAAIASKQLPDFSVEEYLERAKDSEGYLFPETYFVPETFTADDLLRLQSKTFSEMVRPLELEAPTSTLERPSDIIILASIIEREANDENSMKTVAGILLNRLELGMPLQTDVTIEYVLETPLNELKPGELAQYLAELDSPYNLYKNTGLPPTAIGNPGLMAIEAALYPIESDFLYYITGNDGNFYYAKTLTEHNQNVAKYLR